MLNFKVTNVTILQSGIYMYIHVVVFVLHNLFVLVHVYICLQDVIFGDCITEICMGMAK